MYQQESIFMLLILFDPYFIIRGPKIARQTFSALELVGFIPKYRKYTWVTGVQSRSPFFAITSSALPNPHLHQMSVQTAMVAFLEKKTWIECSYIQGDWNLCLVSDRLSNFSESLIYKATVNIEKMLVLENSRKIPFP